MTDLSPQAQAVLSAYRNAPCGNPPKTWIAAALRAAALYCTRDSAILLSLADELEGSLY